MKVMKRKFPVAFVYIAIFVSIAIVMSITGGQSAMFEQTSLNVCVFDEDDTPESHALRDMIAADNKIVQIENDEDVIIDALYYERVSYILTIKKGYAQALASGDTEGMLERKHMHDSYSTVYMGQLIDEYVGTVKAYLAGGMDMDTALAQASDALSKDAEVNVANFSSTENAILPFTTALFFRFLPYILIAAFMNSLCPVLLAISRKDIRFRTNCSGIRPNSYTLQIFIGSAVYVIATWLLFMIVGMILNGGIFTGYAWIAVLNSFVFALFSAILTLFAASFDPSENVISIITQVISLGMSFLCGVFVEQDMLGDGVLAVGRFLPAYWYERVDRMIEGTETFDLSTALGFIMIEVGFTVVIAILTVLVRRVRYSRSAAVAAA